MENPRLQNFIRMQQQRVQMQNNISELTEKCWDMCMKAPSNRLDSKTENCINDCTQRFIDSSNYVINRLQAQAQRQKTPEPFA